jgi:hypothetical protein
VSYDSSHATQFPSAKQEQLSRLTLDDLAETEVGDWKMPDFKLACAYAVSQGWLIIEDDRLTLTTAGLGAG